MSFEACILEIETSTGRKLNEAEKKQVTKKIDTLIKKYDKEVLTETLAEKLDKELDEFGKQLKTAALIEKRNSALNARARIATAEYLKTTWGDELEQGLEAVLADTNINRKGSRNGVATQVTALKNEYMQGLASDLSKKNLLNEAVSGKLDKEIGKAMYHLNSANPDKKLIASMQPEAVDIAQSLIKYQELARKKANQSGAWINRLENRITRRSHDSHKIKKAAGRDVPSNSPKHRQAWMDDVANFIDWDKTFGDVDPELKLEALGDLYEQFANSTHVNFKAAPTNSGFSGVLNIGKKLSKERVLHFKDFDAEWAYHQKYGSDGFLFENVAFELGNLARDTAIMQKLGPQGIDNLEAVVKDLEKDLIKKGQGEKARTLRDKFYTLKKQLWPVITEELNAPESATAEKWATHSANLRTLQAAGDLSAATISSLSDLLFYASTSRYVGDRTAGAFTKGVVEGITEVFGNISKKPTLEERELASELGVFLEAIMPNASRFDADLKQPGQMSNFLQRMMKFNFLNHWQDRVRLAAVVNQSIRVANRRNLPFEQLPEGMKDFFEQFEINEIEWDAIRKQKPVKDSQGRELLTSSAIENMSDDDVASLIPDKIARLKKQKKGVKKAIERAREDLKSKYRNMFSELSTLSATEPSAKDRAFMLRGTRKGSLEGEMLRHFWMYKSFTVSLMRKHLGRELFGYHGENVSVPQALRRLFTDPKAGGLGGLANMMAWAPIFGYAAMTLKDLTKGILPRQPENAEEARKVFAASMLQAGALGIYGDFLFGEMKSRMGQGPFVTLAGPTAGRLNQGFQIWQAFKEGDMKKFIDKASYLGTGLTPGLSTVKNLWYTRAAFDYMVMHRFNEMMNPGYLRRLERRMDKENNKEFIVPPSKVIPRGGF